jgi:hypothetical protein
MATAAAAPLPPPFAGVCKLALLQTLAGSDKAANLVAARAAIAEAAAAGAQIIALPECFNSPYATAQFPVYAEPIPATAAALSAAEHPSTHMLSAAAAAHGVYLVGGSIPEVAEGKVYNTCVAFGPDGALLARHRKMHLFDIDIPGRITFRESDTLTAGAALATFDTPYGRCGLGVRASCRGCLRCALGCPAARAAAAVKLTPQRPLHPPPHPPPLPSCADLLRHSLPAPGAAAAAGGLQHPPLPGRL